MWVDDAPPPDYYGILGLPNTASQLEIRLAYLPKIKAAHPDPRFSHDAAAYKDAEALTKQITEAYAVLSDPERRKDHDAKVAWHNKLKQPAVFRLRPKRDVRRRTRAASPLVPPTPTPPPSPPRKPLVARFTPSNRGLVLTVDASACSTDPQFRLTQYIWSWNRGHPAEVVSTPHHTHAYPKAGSYDVTLTVVDSGGRRSSTLLQTIQVIPKPAISDFEVKREGFKVCIPPRKIKRTPSSSPIYTFDWGDKLRDGKNIHNNTHTYREPGPYTIRVTATNWHDSDTLAKDIIIHAPAPVINRFEVQPKYLQATIDADISDNFEEKKVINWGDGCEDGLNTHTYTEPAMYPVSIRVTNRFGKTTTAQTTVTAERPPLSTDERTSQYRIAVLLAGIAADMSRALESIVANQAATTRYTPDLAQVLPDASRSLRLVRLASRLVLDPDAVEVVPGDLTHLTNRLLSAPSQLRQFASQVASTARHISPVNDLERLALLASRAAMAITSEFIEKIERDFAYPRPVRPMPAQPGAFNPSTREDSEKGVDEDRTLPPPGESALDLDADTTPLTRQAASQGEWTNFVASHEAWARHRQPQRDPPLRPSQHTQSSSTSTRPDTMKAIPPSPAVVVRSRPRAPRRQIAGKVTAAILAIGTIGIIVWGGMSHKQAQAREDAALDRLRDGEVTTQCFALQVQQDQAVIAGPCGRQHPSGILAISVSGLPADLPPSVDKQCWAEFDHSSTHMDHGDTINVYYYSDPSYIVVGTGISGEVRYHFPANTCIVRSTNKAITGAVISFNKDGDYGQTVEIHQAKVDIEPGAISCKIPTSTTDVCNLVGR